MSDPFNSMNTVAMDINVLPADIQGLSMDIRSNGETARERGGGHNHRLE